MTHRPFAAAAALAAAVLFTSAPSAQLRVTPVAEHPDAAALELDSGGCELSKPGGTSTHT